MILQTITYRRGDIIRVIKPDENHVRKENFFPITWFRPKGYTAIPQSLPLPYIGYYYVNQDLNLVNLGQSESRQQIKKQILRDNGTLLNTYTQYLFPSRNLELHKLLMSHPDLEEYDGTITTKTSSNMNLKTEEVVLFERAYTKIGLLRASIT